MKYNVSFFSVLFVIILGCSHDKPTGPAEDAGPKLTEVTIGSEGGNLNTDDFEVAVPPGAFSSGTNLQLYRITENPFDSNSNSSTFKLEGIPSEFSKPLEIKIKYFEKITGSPLIAVGQEAYVKSSGEIRTVYRFITAVDSGNFLKCKLVPSTSTEGIISKRNSAKSDNLTVFLNAVTGYDTYYSVNNHFVISYPYIQSQADVIALAADLEDAYDLFKNMGFDYKKRTEWPIKVSVDKMDNTKFGEAVFKMYGYNSAWIEFNKSKLNDRASVRITAGHEFFHIVQNLYYPSLSFSVATGKYTWLDEAFSVWSEAMFTDRQDYISTVRGGNEWAPFFGLQSNSLESDAAARAHGYGVSAVVKYLSERYDGNFALDTYTRVSQNEHPVDAVVNTYGSPVSWWSDFINKYASAGIYKDIKPTEISANLRSGTFDVKTGKDTLKKFTSEFPDISAKAYVVYLRYPEISSDAKLIVDCNGGLSEISVFKFNSSVIEKLDGPSQLIEIPKIRNIMKEGFHIILLTANSRALTPYTDNSKIETEVKIADYSSNPLAGYDNCYLFARWHGEYSKSSGESIEADVSRTYEVTGTWTGNVFAGKVYDDRYIDSIYTVFDTEFMMISEFKAYFSTDFDQSKEHVFGSDLQLQFENEKYISVIEGNNTCDHISSIEDIGSGEDPFVLTNFTCNENSKIEIRFSKP